MNIKQYVDLDADATEDMKTIGLSEKWYDNCSSDKTLQLNAKPLNKSLGIINQLQPVEYDQTHDLTKKYTPDTAQSHQCGYIGQSVHQIEELKHAVVGGDVGEEGKDSINHLKYNA